MDADDLFPETGSKAPSPRDLCATQIERLAAGSVVAVGGKAWQVWRSQGLTKYLTKAGAKGKKLYRLHATEVEPRCCVEVREVEPGSGTDKKLPPAASGCFVEEGVFMGGSRKKKRP
jgi:hypothetical protein